MLIHCFIFTPLSPYLNHPPGKHRVFIHRCRDVFPVLRAESIKSLLKCIVAYPAYFLEESFLPYLESALKDEVWFYVYSYPSLSFPMGEEAPCTIIHTLQILDSQDLHPHSLVLCCPIGGNPGDLSCLRGENSGRWEG